MNISTYRDRKNMSDPTRQRCTGEDRAVKVHLVCAERSKEWSGPSFHTNGFLVVTVQVDALVHYARNQKPTNFPSFPPRSHAMPGWDVMLPSASEAYFGKRRHDAYS